MKPIIKVENLSKSYIIGHESRERYTTLRDQMARKAKSWFSFGKGEKIKHTTEEFWALKDINFEINQGDRIGIIGRNGAGKSTLLKILSRITEPTTGKITISGRVASLLEVGTGFHPELTGRENIFLNGAILGMSRAEIRKKFDEIVDFAEVEKFLDTPVKRYSSGMYVRLAFAVAAHLEPEILIVDEVLAVGDAQFQKKCLGKMEDVSLKEGRTVLFVSHNMGMIGNLCNEGVLINKGQVEINGNINDVMNCYISKNNHASNFNYSVSDEHLKNKINYFNTINLVNSKDEATSDFSLDENIRIRFSFTLNEVIPNVLIGIGIQDKFQNRITTLLKPVDFFSILKDNVYCGSVVLPSGILAPNIFSFVFAIWLKDVIIYDLLENICSFKIHDNGTENSLYKELDYGSIILKANWTND